MDQNRLDNLRVQVDQLIHEAELIQSRINQKLHGVLAERPVNTWTKEGSIADVTLDRHNKLLVRFAGQSNYVPWKSIKLLPE